MEEISIFLQPYRHSEEIIPESLASFIDLYKKNDEIDVSSYDIAIFSVYEGVGETARRDFIRENLYNLYMEKPSVKILDLGNVLPGHGENDTEFALETICKTLIEKAVIPVVIGDNQRLTFSMYRSFAFLERMVNLVGVDPVFDIGDTERPLDDNNYLSKIILEQPNFLFNYSHLAYQTYLVSPEITKMLNKMYFDLHRLGEVRGMVKEYEPILRGSDLVSIDMSAIRKSDFPAHDRPQVNGLSGEDACQLAFYAGMSDKIKAIGLFGYREALDQRGQSAQLTAQMIWFFIDGFRARSKDSFIYDKERFTKFLVPINADNEIIFFKSKQTDRWWMEVPYPVVVGERFKRTEYVPCSYSDYEQASNGDLPERWLYTYNKFM